MSNGNLPLNATHWTCPFCKMYVVYGQPHSCTDTPGEPPTFIVSRTFEIEIMKKLNDMEKKIEDLERRIKRLDYL